MTITIIVSLIITVAISNLFDHLVNYQIIKLLQMHLWSIIVTVHLLILF